MRETHQQIVGFVYLILIAKFELFCSFGFGVIIIIKNIWIRILLHILQLSVVGTVVDIVVSQWSGYIWKEKCIFRDSYFILYKAE